MSDPIKQCLALTKNGTRCKLKARPNANYCHIHRHLVVNSPTSSLTASPADDTSVSPEQEELQALLAELNQLADELRTLVPEYSPPPFSKKQLLKLIKENADKFTPDMQSEILQDLQAGLQGATPKDFMDAETWKGLWYVLHHLMQTESSGIKERCVRRLSALPGVNLVIDLKNSFQGTTPEDLLDVETWKGMWYVVNHMLQTEAQAIKQRVLGSDEDA